MEWLVLIVLALVAVALIALPRAVPLNAATESHLEEATLIEERRILLSELRELDEDAAAGRISAEDRLAGRRALAPRLRAVTETLQRLGVRTGTGEPG